MFRVCSEYIQVCSEYVQSVFRVCSVINVFAILSNLGHIFRVCSECVQSVFRECSECVQSVFRVCSILKSFHHLAHPVCQFLDLFICVPICAAYVFILCKISEILMFALQWSDNACFCRKQLRLSVQFDWRLSGRLYTISNILILTIMVSIYSTCTCAVFILGSV